MKRACGFTLLELLVTVSLFSIVTLVSFVLLMRGGELWRDTSGQHTSTISLAKIDRHFRQDLPQASKASVSTDSVPGSLAGAPDGSALWFLSARESGNGSPVRKNDGTPFWQRNVLYYLAVPTDHQQTYGMVCTGATGIQNDDYCPHKVLIRVVIDSGSPTGPTSDLTTEEQILTDVTPYLLRPSGQNVPTLLSMSEVESVEIVASPLLYFEAQKTDDEVAIEVGATSLEGLGRKARVGSETLVNHTNTMQYLKSFFPRNP